MQKLVTIRPGVSYLFRDFAHQKRVSFFGFLQLATAKGRGRILTQNTPQHAVPPKDVSKCKEIVFRKPNVKLDILPDPLADIERVSCAKLLGVFIDL